MKACNLFFMVDLKYGGFISYTKHLFHALNAEGVVTRVWKVRKRFESKLRLLHEVPYQNVTLDYAVQLARSAPAIVTCAYWKHNPEAIDALLAAGAAIVVHDPTELAPELVASMRRHNSRVVAIRQKNVANYREHALNVELVPHPYCAAEVAPVARRLNACALSRIDYDKHTEVIAEANTLLSPGQRVEIHGQANRLYVHHKLAKQWPSWETQYRGAFPTSRTAGVELAARHRYVVDMSLIKGDGGGTQYTFFEAWNAGSALVIDERWVLPGDELEPGRNCYVVRGAEQLAARMRARPDADVVEGGVATMRQHDSAAVVARLRRVLCGT